MSDGIAVVKMSGAGNDFLVLGPDEAARLGPRLVEWARRACRRGLSVGADGVLVVEPAGAGVVSVRFHNPDGSAAFCGNGSRCAARFAALRGWAAGSALTLRTAVGDVAAEVVADRVRLRLPAPVDRGAVELEHRGEAIEGRLIDAGVPHFVVFVTDLATDALARWGPIARRHPRFGPAGTNLDLVERRAAGTIALRTWERGVEGETLACGSGAIAAALAHRIAGGAERVTVIPASGIALGVELPGAPAAPDAALLEGDARVIFEGTVSDEAVR